MRRRYPRWSSEGLSPCERAKALAAVDEALARAKHRFSLAALACLRGAIDADVQVKGALAELDRARAQLAQAEVVE